MVERDPPEGLVLHANAVPVHGANRSVILDLQAQRIHSIPGAFTPALRLLEEARGRPLPELGAAQSPEERARLIALASWLEERGLAARTRHPERFPALNLAWRHPGPIYSAVVDLDADSRHDLAALSASLVGLGCVWLTLRLAMDQAGARLEPLLEALGDAPLNLEIQLAAWPDPDLDALRALLRARPRIARLTLFGAAERRVVQAPPSGFGGIHLAPEPLRLDEARAPDREQMGVTLEQAAIARDYNLSLYKAVAIDTAGRIKNTVGPAPAFGQLPEDPLEDVVRRADFQAAWAWHKGLIAGCDRCELRRCCADPRWPVRGEDGALRYTSDCAYDPESGRWRDAARPPERP